VETKLLNTIFDDNAPEGEIKNAVAALKRKTGKDRAGLVDRYVSAAASDAGERPSSSLDTMMQLLNAQTTIRALQRELERADKRYIDTIEMYAHVADERRYIIDKYEYIVRQIATAALKANWLNSSLRAMLERASKFSPNFTYETEELIHVARGLIEGPIKQAFAKANQVEQLEPRKPARDRKDYMREYMQKKRAAEAKAR
jgi:Asp-tRNA(Asn)/Glu-tRNA(Gln) amidotransferase B subunit